MIKENKLRKNEYFPKKIQNSMRRKTKLAYTKRSIKYTKRETLSNFFVYLTIDID